VSHHSRRNSARQRGSSARPGTVSCSMRRIARLSVANASISSARKGHGSPGPVIVSAVWRDAMASNVPPGATRLPMLMIAWRRGGLGSACTVMTSTTKSKARRHSGRGASTSAAT
jgi:hypothetical protein